MSQLVKIECSQCEGVEVYEMEGLVLLGYREGRLFMKCHELTLGEAIESLVEFASSKDKPTA